MKDYTNSPQKISRTPGTNNKASNQAPLKTILQKYAGYSQQAAGAENDELRQAQSELVRYHSENHSTPHLLDTSSAIQKKSIIQLAGGYEIIPPDSEATLATINSDYDTLSATNRKLDSCPWVKIGDLYVSVTITGDTSWKPIIDDNLQQGKTKFTFFSGRHGSETGYFQNHNSKLEERGIRERAHQAYDTVSAIKHLISKINKDHPDEYAQIYQRIITNFPVFVQNYGKQIFIRDGKYKEIIEDLNLMESTEIVTILGGENNFREVVSLDLNPGPDIKIIDAFSDEAYLKIDSFKQKIKDEIAAGRVVILAWCFSINALALNDPSRYETQNISEIVQNDFGSPSDYTIP